MLECSRQQRFGGGHGPDAADSSRPQERMCRPPGSQTPAQMWAGAPVKWVKDPPAQIGSVHRRHLHRRLGNTVVNAAKQGSMFRRRVCDPPSGGRVRARIWAGVCDPGGRHMRSCERLLSAASGTCAPPNCCCLLHPAHAPRRAAAVCCIRHMRPCPRLLSATADTCAPADDCFLLHPRHARRRSAAVCCIRNMCAAEPPLSAAFETCALQDLRMWLCCRVQACRGTIPATASHRAPW